MEYLEEFHQIRVLLAVVATWLGLALLGKKIEQNELGGE